MQQRKQLDVEQRNCITVHRTQGRPVVFGHGFGCDQLIWLSVIEQLPGSVAPITFDYMGCGRSDVSAYDKKNTAALTAMYKT